MKIEHQSVPPDVPFVGIVSDPFYSLKITKGLVEFYVRPTTRGTLSPGKEAELIDQTGKAHSVVVRGIGHITPDPASKKWRPGDILIRVEGITIDQAANMIQIRQVYA